MWRSAGSDPSREAGSGTGDASADAACVRRSRLSPAGVDPRAAAVGARLPRVDGWPKVAGTDLLRRRRGAGRRAVDARGALAACPRALHARRSRCGRSRARRASSRSSPPRTCRARTPSASFPSMKDQPVLAPGLVRFRGEAVLALVGTRAAVEGISDADLPIAWTPSRAALRHRGGAGARRAARSMPHVADNVLTRGNLQMRRCRRRPRRGGRDRRRPLRDRLRRARLYRAGGRLRRPTARPGPHRGHRLHAGALHGPEETARVLGVEPTQRAHPPDRLRRRLRRQARRLGAAAAGGRGVGDQAARCASSTRAPS